MCLFDVYAFADYSGSERVAGQQNAIALAVLPQEIKVACRQWTREKLRDQVIQILIDSTLKNKRVFFGFDHQYSFPMGLFEELTGGHWVAWDQVLHLLGEGGYGLPPVGNSPRKWAEMANDRIITRLGVSKGPFWGPNFSQEHDPRFPFGKTIIKERRLVEERQTDMKPIFKIGGPGSVGLQSIAGIPHLYSIKAECKRLGLPLFCWPFDGWDCPSEGHILVEIYPRLMNFGPKNDVADAKETAKAISSLDKNRELERLLKPSLTEEEKQRAQLEGWVIGVK